MWNSLRTLGTLSVALFVGAAPSFAGELSNVTLGRFQDFTVVTLFGDGPMSVTHQIVEAKDGKPHRIVVDITGALHKLPQNNYEELPEGSITSIRTSQFAVSPEPVVRVVLDLAHPAAYRMETPDQQVRVMVSLPGDPPLSRVWSARDGMLNAEPFEPSGMLADAEPQAEAGPDAAAVAAEPAPATATETESAPVESPAVMDAASQAPAAEPSDAEPASQSDSAQPESEPSTPEWENPAKSAQPEDEVKGLPVAPAGALAAGAEAAPQESTEALATPAEAEPLAESQGASEALPAGETVAALEAVEVSETVTEPANAATDEPRPALAETAQEPMESQEPASAEVSELAAADDVDAPQVPMPDEAIEQPERVIDYNLPIPAALAGGVAPAQDEAAGETPSSESESAPAPKLAVTTPQAGTEAKRDASSSAPTGTEAAVTDSGSAPVASLTTLPPLAESAAELVPQRTQVIYHTQGRRDPFKALLTSGGYNAAALPDVTSLRLVGLLHDVQESWGLFEDANGYGYILRKGDRVKNGKLTQLTNNRAFFSITEFGWSRSVHIDLEPEG